MNKWIMTCEQKCEIIEALKGSDPIKANEIKKRLPKSCFINGNTSAINWKALDKFIVTNEETAFIKTTVKMWAGRLEQFSSNPAEALLACKILSATTYGCKLTEGIYKSVLAEVGIKMPAKVNRKVDEKLLRRVAKKLGIKYLTASLSLYAAEKRTMATTMIENLCSNVQAAIDASKAKKVAEKEVKILADPKLSQFRAYGKKNYRPDIVITYKDKKEDSYMMAEHFGWTGSASYIAKQSEKLALAVESGVPFFYSAPEKSMVVMEIPSDATGLEKAVYDWNKANFFVAENSVDAVYQEMNAMLNYIGLGRFLPTPEKAFIR